METTFNCPSCRQQISTDVPAGMQVQCPLCNRVVTVPREAGVVADAVGRGPVAGGAFPPGGGGAVQIEYASATGQPTSRGMAVASLVCGIIGLLGFWALGSVVGLVGLILGIIAVVKIKRHRGKYGGRGMAIGGICTGALSILIIPLMLAALLPSLSRARELSKRTVCQANMRGIGQALYIYANNDPDGMFPEEGANWQARLVSAALVTPTQFSCPSDTRASISSYYYVPGYGMKSDPAQIILYEDPSIHGGEGGNVLYQDGHVAFEKSPTFDELIDSITLPDGRLWAPHKAP
ncbi:MAG: DUF4190 domain-containing protein [Phycisphaerae bacterium]|nr:DUF4190 domain-containing protein [Phycisphaerae bacterium]